MRRRLRTALATTVLVAAPVLVTIAQPGPAGAHGTLSNPPSRVYACKQENPESPSSAACRAAVAAAGPQAFYDWNEVSLLDAGGRHREIIPDGRLCSAGREKFRGLDLRRGDWPATRIAAGNLTVTYTATAPHAGSNFEFYITRDGWSPTQPLRWADLVHLKTFTNQNPTTATNWTIPIPKRSGRHVLYSIWQRVQGSQEAFYTCSDVDFGGSSSSPPAPAPTTPVTPTPPQAPSPGGTSAGGGTWTLYSTYRIGQRVTYGGRSYECRQSHTAYPGWDPPNVLALWLPV